MNTFNVGKLKIYSNQIDSADEIMNIFRQKGGPPLLVSQPQQGKTGVCIKVIHDFRNWCKTNDFTYEIIFLCNLSDNHLKGQTKARFFDAFIAQDYNQDCSDDADEIKSIFFDAMSMKSLPDVRVIHHAELNKTEIRNVDYRLLIIDECHVALEKSDVKSKPFYDFLNKLGIDYGKPIADWGNKNNFVLSVSATPFAHVVANHIDNSAFKPVRLEMSDVYYSLQRMNADDRIKKSSKLINKNNNSVTPFFIDRVNDFIGYCKTDGNGHMVVRCSGKLNVATIKTYIENEFINEIDFQIYDCDLNNVEKISDALGEMPIKPTINLIKGSMRAGKTLKTTKFIRIWIETASSNGDAMIQAVGRSLGNPDPSVFADYETVQRFINKSEENKQFVENLGLDLSTDLKLQKMPNHCKFFDTYPIYCNTSHLDSAIEFYDDYEVCPQGNWSLRYKPFNDYDYEEIIFDMNDYVDYNQMKEYANKILNEKAIKGKQWEVARKNSINRKSQNVIGEFLNGAFARDMGKKSKGKDIISVPLWGLNGLPEGKKDDADFVAAWEKLKQDRPDLVGKWVLQIPKNYKRNDKAEELIRDRCIFKPNSEKTISGSNFEECSPFVIEKSYKNEKSFKVEQKLNLIQMIKNLFA